MRNKTFNSYNRAVVDEYESKKHTLYGGRLLNPSPAVIRDLALLCYDSLNALDKEAFKRFFDLKDDKDKRKQIESFELGRLRKFDGFLKKGTSKTTDILGLEVIAILIDFRPRPLQKFLEPEMPGREELRNDDTQSKVEKPVANEVISLNEIITKEVKEPVNAFYSNVKKQAEAEGNDAAEIDENVPQDTTDDIKHLNSEIPLQFILPQHKNNKRYQVERVTFISVLVFAVIFILKTTFFTGSDCMMWKEDHYEEVPCSGQVHSLVSSNVIAASNELIKYQKKIKVCDTTTFFSNGKPIIWYGKSPDKGYEFFTHPGVHPETGKSLKDITPYIINKYVNNE